MTKNIFCGKIYIVINFQFNVEERLCIDKEKEIVCGLSGIGHISDKAKKHGRNFRFRGEDLR
ncbi:hypothetical protein [Bacillus sp. BP-3]|uniref:hypothetical protein n=1 Tax=Bacillus sp. BP-3 TaxID=3022773 RepID=UPI00232D9977|nr:hypothetical protein [Bacillus sp. BP-3]